MGGSSTTRCLLCKRRDVQCDGRRPACLRCPELGIACPGYVKRPRQPKAGNLTVKASKARRQVEAGMLGCVVTPSPTSMSLESHLAFNASVPPLPGGSRFSQDQLKLMFCKYLSKHPIYDKVSEAIRRPLSAALFLGAIYNTIGDYHAMRDEPASQISAAVKVEALRLLNASLSNSECPARLETMFSIVFMGAGAMNYPNGDWMEYDQHLQAARRIADDHKDLILSTPFGTAMPMMVTFQSLREATSDISLDANQAIIKSLPPADSPLLSVEGAIAAQQDSPELACYSPFGFNTSSYSETCKPATLDILWHVHEVVKITHIENLITLDRAIRAKLIDIHLRWLRKLPPAYSYASPHHDDFIYECCRLTALLQMSMLEHDSLTDTRPLITQLKEALKKTDLAKYWGNMLGVLWWVLTSK